MYNQQKVNREDEMALLGRKKECQFLTEVIESKKAEFIAIYGRRRVGKTFLINEFFQKKGVYFELTGRKRATRSAQLYNFMTVFSDVFQQGDLITIPKNWDEAFHLLRCKIDALDSEKKVILFLDELPWLSSKKSGFLEALDLFWNRYMSRKSNVIVIVCGSAAEWMIKKVVSNKSGLHNRLTRPSINLKPFNLQETEEYLIARGVCLDRKQLVDLYMVLGGVAYYLDLVPRGKSSTEIISALFFAEEAPLLREFDNLFHSLYDKADKHIQIIKALSQTVQGLTQGELFHQVKALSVGGSSVSILEELEHCGFISLLPEFGKKKKDTRYRLTDPFALFYLKWVEGVRKTPEFYFARKKDSQGYRTWAGYAFENLCFQHYPQILSSLGLSVVAELYSSWRFVPSRHSEEKGAQIDLVIDRADACINLCEIKFYSDEFAIDKEYAKILQAKKSCFKEKTKTRKTVFLTLITPYGVKKEQNYLGSVDGQLTLDAFFK